MAGSTAILAGLLMVAAVAAEGEERTISLIDGAGTALPVARLHLAPDGTFAVDWDEGLFADHFLSMRPFRCLGGPEKLWCRVPYPYENRRSLAGGDLTDLEYDLLFVWKDAGDYGIDLWNGVYYRLNEAGGAIEGRLHEIDLDVLSAPPGPGVLRPIRDQDLSEGVPESHWLPALRID